MACFHSVAAAVLFAPVGAQAGPGYALAFDRASGQSMNVTNFGFAIPTNEITIEFWQKSESEAGQLVFALEPEDPHNGVRAMVSREDGAVCWDFGDGHSAGCLAYWPPDSIAGTWQHFAFVASAKGNFMRVYRNGVEEARKTGMTPLLRRTGTLVLAPPRPQNRWAGQLDEFRVWSMARTQAQIQEQMRRELTGREAGLVACWQFNEGKGNVAADATGRGLEGRILGEPIWERSPMPPILSSALSFNGASQYVRVPGGVRLGEEFTIEAWVFQRALHSSARLLSFGNDIDTDQIVALLSLETSGYPTLGVSGAEPLLSGRKSIVRGTQKLPLNVWTHLAFSRDAAGAGHVYVNASEVGTGPLAAPRTATRTNNFIGGATSLTNGAADAIFDEIRVWNVARSGAELGAGMKHHLTGAEPELIAYWRCDDGRGKSLSDASGNTNAGTLVGNPKWVGATAPLWQGPTATTAAAGEGATTQLRLHGAVYPNGLPTSAWFEWGSTAHYGQRTRVIPVGDGRTLSVMSEPVHGLGLAGTYHYRLACSNSAGLAFGADQSLITPVGTILGLTVRTWCLTVLLPLVVGAALVGASLRFQVVRRLTRKLESLRAQETRQGERIRISRDLHDDLGARLTKISLLTELARRAPPGSSLAEEHIARISLTARETAQALDEIVWAVDPDHDSLDHFGSYLCPVVEEFFSDTPIRCRLNVPALLPAIALPATVRHHLLLAVKEALNNLLKYSGATEALVGLASDARSLTLIVEDNGRGFDPAVVGTGNGLANMCHRLETIGGTCRFEKPPGGGTRVILSVPLERAALLPS